MGKSFALDSKTFHTSASIKHGYAALPGRDVKLHYVISGPKDGTPVVLLHGWPQVNHVEFGSIERLLTLSCVPDVLRMAPFDSSTRRRRILCDRSR